MFSVFPHYRPYVSKEKGKKVPNGSVYARLFVTPWTIAHQACLCMGFSRQKHCSGLPRSPPGDLPDPGIELRSPALQADSLPSEPPGNHICIINAIIYMKCYLI